MLISNDKNRPLRGGWVGIDVHQTIIYNNVTLYLSTGLSVPSVPRLEEEIEVFSNVFAGKVAAIKHQVHFNTYYRDNPGVRLDPKELPRFNDHTIRIDLEKSKRDDCIFGDQITEAFIDSVYVIRATRKERQNDYKFLAKVRGDPDYKMHFLQDVTGPEAVFFDPKKFDEEFPFL